MNTYLVCYGTDNDLWLCEAENTHHAKEQFYNAEVTNPADGDTINGILLCVPTPASDDPVCPQCDGQDEYCVYCEGKGEVTESQKSEWRRQHGMTP